MESNTVPVLICAGEWLDRRVSLVVERIERVSFPEWMVVFFGALFFSVSCALILYCPMESTAASAIGDMDEMIGYAAQRSPLPRGITPEEVGSAADARADESPDRGRSPS